MKQKKSLIRAVIALFLAAAVIASSLLIGGAVWNEETAVHVDPKEIPSATLAVGTHLIHLSTLNDSVYAVAERSAEESGQTSTYYKSELADGTWFDISSATTLADITTAGTPVEDSVIAALFFTHHTRDDGVTYDLRTNLPVDIRDIYSPYDLESMEELFPLKTQYDLLRETQADSKAGKAKIERAAAFFATSVINDTTISYDGQLAALQVYYNVLNENDGGTVEKNAVQEVMDAVDASRRVAVFTIVEEALATYLEELSTVADTQDEEGNTADEGTMPDTNLQSAVSDSLNNVRASKIEYEGKMLDPGTTVITSVRYTFSQQLITDANARNHAACDTDVAQLVTLNNIVNGIIQDKAAELALLDDPLIPQAANVYTGGLRQGQTPAYTAAVAQQSANALLQSIIRDNTSLLNSYRNELEFFIEAKTQRQSTQDASDYITERLNITQGWYTILPSDPFEAQSSTTVDAHVEFLTQLQRSLELAAGGNELDALLAEKEDLQAEMMSCLDHNDLAGAKAYEDQISAVDEKIQALSNETNSQLSALNQQLNELENQLAAAQDSGSDQTTAQLQQEIETVQSEIDQVLAAGDGTLGEQLSQLQALNEQLNDLAGQLANAQSSGNSEAAAQLQQQMEHLQSEVDRAEAAASKSEEGAALVDQLSALNETLSGLEEQRRDAQTGPSQTTAQLQEQIGALKAEIAQVEAAAGDGTLGAQVAQLKRDTLTAIQDGDTDAVNEGVDALSDLLSLDYGLVFPALQELHQAMAREKDLNGNDSLDDAINTIEEAILNNADAYTAAMRTEKNATDLLELAEDYFAGETSPLTPTGAETGAGVGAGSGGTGENTGGESGLGGKGALAEETVNPAITLVALQLYYDETGNQDALSLLSSVSLQQQGLGNPLVFLRVNDAGREYLPLSALSAYTGMRYVWNRTLSLGTLAQGGIYYGFTAYFDGVRRSRDTSKTDRMTQAAKFQGGMIHIFEDYTRQEFGAEAVYLAGTNYAVLCDSAMLEEATALFGVFLAG
ncbi:MAG: hypothetical protein HFE97_11235 [Oscillospiraceae bacterium]|nr:hypothetical protein [Oscillospiraceae bacterium]